MVFKETLILCFLMESLVTSFVGTIIKYIQNHYLLKILKFKALKTHTPNETAMYLVIAGVMVFVTQFKTPSPLYSERKGFL